MLKTDTPEIQPPSGCLSLMAVYLHGIRLSPIQLLPVVFILYIGRAVTALVVCISQLLSVQVDHIRLYLWKPCKTVYLNVSSCLFPSSSPSSPTTTYTSDVGADRDTVDMASGSQWILRYQPVAELVLAGAARLI